MVESLIWNAMLNANGVTSGLAAIASSANNTASAAKGLEGALGGIAKVSFVGLVAGIAGVTAAIATSITSAATWEKELSRAAKTALSEGGNVAQFSKDLRSELMNLRGVSQSDYMSAVGKAGSMGFSDKDAAKVATLYAKAASAFEIPIDTASTQLGVINQLWKSTGNSMAGGAEELMSRTGSAVNVLGNKYASSESNILTFTSAVGRTASAFNEDIPTMAAFGSLLETIGIKGEEAATALNSALNAGLYQQGAVSMDVAKALGGQFLEVKKDGTLKAASKVTGMQIAAALSGDTVESLKARMSQSVPETMLYIFDNIKKFTKDENLQKEIQQSIFGTYGEKLSGISGHGDEYKAMLADAKKGWQENTSMEKEYATQTNNLIDKWSQLKQVGNIAFATLGEFFTPSISKVMEGWIEKAKGFVGWIEKIKTASGGDIGKALSQVMKDFNIKDKLKDAGKIVLSVVGGAAALVGITRVITALKGMKLAALGTAVITSIFSTIKGATIGLQATISATRFGSVATAITSAFSPLLGILGTIGTAIATLAIPIALVSVGLGAIGYALNPEKFTTFNKIVTDTFTGLKSLASDLYKELMEGDYNGAATRLQTAFTDAWNYIKGIDWRALGGEIITMISDGATALIDTALDFGGKLYNNISGWVSSGGPRQLGQDIATTISDAIAWALDNTGNIWDTISSIFGTVSNWLSLGWDIAKGIGQGILDKIYEKIQPIGREMIVKFAIVALSLEESFAKTWNSVLIAAGKTVDGIISAFSGIGGKIAGFFDPVISKIKEISGASPIGYYNPDSGGRMTPEQYNKAPDEEKSKYNAQYSTIPNSVASKNYAFSSTPTEGSNISGSNLIGSNTEWSVMNSLSSLYTGITTGKWSMDSGGYRSGGKGFISSEMMPGSQPNTLMMTTDRGDKATWSGAEEIMKGGVAEWLMNNFSADYIVNKEKVANEFADKLFPAAESIKRESEANTQASKINAEQTITAGKTFAFDVNSSGLNIYDGWKGASALQYKTSTDSATQWQAASSSSSKSITDAGTNFYNGSNQASKNALVISAQVSSNFASGGNAVSIGLTASGKEIAVIGSVARKQYEEGGKLLTGSITSSSATVLDNATKTGTTLVSSGLQAGTSITTSGTSFKADVADAATSLKSALTVNFSSLASAIANIQSKAINYASEKVLRFKNSASNTSSNEQSTSILTKILKFNAVPGTRKSGGIFDGYVKVANTEPLQVTSSSNQPLIVSSADTGIDWVSEMWNKDYSNAYKVQMNTATFASSAKGGTPIVEKNTQNKLINPWTDEALYSVNKLYSANKNGTASTNSLSSARQNENTKIEQLDASTYKLTNDIGGTCEAVSPFMLQQESMKGLFKEQSIVIKDSLTPAQREAYRQTQNLAKATAEYAPYCEANTEWTLTQEEALNKVTTSYIGSTAGYNALGLGVNKSTIEVGKMDKNVVQLGGNSVITSNSVGKLNSDVSILGSNVQKSSFSIGEYNKQMEVASVSAAKGAYSFGLAVNTWNGVISDSAMQAAQSFIAKQKFDLAGGNKDEYGEIDYGTDAVVNSLVKLTAENGRFCEAMSDFGLAQENTIGIFQQSYIGKTSEYAAFKEFDAALAAANQVNMATQEQASTIDYGNKVNKEISNAQTQTWNGINQSQVDTTNAINTNNQNTASNINQWATTTYGKIFNDNLLYTQQTNMMNNTTWTAVNNNLNGTASVINTNNTALSNTATSVDTAAGKLDTAAAKLDDININVNYGGGGGGGSGWSWSGGNWGGGQSPGGAGSFGSGKASWVGTGRTQSGWGAVASAAASRGGYGGYSDSSFRWGAKGADIKGPTALIAGEKGEELLLPAPITKTIKDMVGNTRLNNSMNNGNTQIVVKVYLGEKDVTDVVMKTAMSTMQLNGMSIK